jgi:aspartate-semialdehyde dehydrogenase
MPKKKIPIALLGATGVVGQKVIALLDQNPLFFIAEVSASEGKKETPFSQACHWKEPLMECPKSIESLKLKDPLCIQSEFIISALPTQSAKKIEPALAKLGHTIFSNAAAFRMHPDVPLLVPEINMPHLTLVHRQKTSGKIVTNPNCCAVGVALALAPFQRLGKIQHVSVVTLQSISGAGFPGIASLDILGNTIPYIEDEADKITHETKKILGSADKPASFPITTHVHRVPVLYGHTATLHITFQDPVDPMGLNHVKQAYQRNPYVLHEQPQNPQPLRTLHHADMRTHIGALRMGDTPHTVGLVCLTHNLVRGAAGAAIANLMAFLKI